MTDLQKNNIKQWTGSVIASILVFMVGFSITAARDDRKNYDNEIKQLQIEKVDKIEFKDHELRDENRRKEQEQSNLEIKTALVKIMTDVEWIREEQERTRKK